MTSNSRFNSQSGFTLLEVLIAFVVLVFISFAIYQLTTNTFKLRANLNVEGDFYNEVRLSLGLLKQDVSMIFSPKLVIPPSKKKKTTSNQPPAPITPERDPPSEFWGGTIDQETGIRNTRFLGEEDRIVFVSSTNLRIYRDSPQSVYSKIEYAIVSDDKELDGVDEKTLVLVKRNNPNVFDLEEDDDDFTQTFPLLRGIRTWKFRYYFKPKDRWYSEWDSRKSEFKDVFPDIIEAKMNVIGPNGKEFEGFYRFRPDIPFEGLDANF